MRRAPVRFGLSILAAVLLGVSVPRFDLWPCMWVGLLPALVVALTSATPKRAFLHGWLTGTIANTFGFYWLLGLFERFAHMPALEATPIMLLLTGYQGLTFALWSWGMFRLVAVRPRVPLALLVPLVMAALELLMPQIFPYYLGFSQVDFLPLIQIADLTGPIGVTFVVLMMTGALADAGRWWWANRAARATMPAAAVARGVLRPLAIPAGLLALVLGYGAIRIHQIDGRRAAAPHVRVGAVQANIGIVEKWDPGEAARLLRLHQALSLQLARKGAELIVWPESSYPYALPRDIAADFPVEDPRRIRPPGLTAPMLFGAVTRARSPRIPAERFPYNTALMLDSDGRITGKYDKVYLLMFGEYIPFYDQVPWFTDYFPDASNFSRGTDPTVFPFHAQGRDFRLAPLICYEDILPRYARGAAELKPNLLVNITNDAWFGKTAEPYQHLALSVFRSVEHRLDMIRSVNTGVTAHVDAVGRVRETLASVNPDEVPHPEPEAMLADVAMLDAGGLYVRIGDAFGLLCAAAIAILAFTSAWASNKPRRKKRKAG